MQKDEPLPARLSHTLQADSLGTILVSQLTSYLKTLPQDSRIGTSLTQHGPEWFLELNPLDLFRVPSGTEQTKTPHTFKSQEYSE